MSNVSQNVKSRVALFGAGDGYGSKSTNSDLTGFYLLFYIQEKRNVNFLGV
jgi:hypothetical protein